MFITEPTYSSMKIKPNIVLSVFQLVIMKGIKRAANLQFPSILLILAVKYYAFLDYNY